MYNMRLPLGHVDNSVRSQSPTSVNCSLGSCNWHLSVSGVGHSLASWGDALAYMEPGFKYQTSISNALPNK
jgi:hypothetical protein